MVATSLSVNHIQKDFSVKLLGSPEWRKALPVRVTEYWSGKPAPKQRTFVARVLWSDSALYVLFDAKQEEPLVVADRPDLTRKAMNLWDRDVFEIFLAPDRNEPRKYLEFEAAPTGEWLDVALDSTSGKRISDWDYKSDMETAAKIEKDRVIVGMKIPWMAFGKKPEAGDVWLGNIFRCVGREPDRGYLAWRPTMTKTPNFHVPGAFAEFHFIPSNKANVRE